MMRDNDISVRANKIIGRRPFQCMLLFVYDLYPTPRLKPISGDYSSAKHRNNNQNMGMYHHDTTRRRACTCGLLKQTLQKHNKSIAAVTPICCVPVPYTS